MCLVLRVFVSLSRYGKAICVYLRGAEMATEHTTACDGAVTKGVRCVDTSCYCDVIVCVDG